MSWHTSLADALAGNELLERLCFAALELLVLSLVLAAVVRWARFASLRVVALLWLIVLAKPVVTLAAGAPIAVFWLEASAVAASQPVETPVPSAHGLAPQPDAGLETALVNLSDSDALRALPAGEQAASAGTTERAGLEARPFRLDTLLLAAWAIGVAFGSVRYALVRRRLRGYVACACRPPQPLEGEYAQLARELGLRRVPRLRVTKDLESPALVGLARPVVLLPHWLVERGHGASLAWALRHELAHWRWLDPLAILVRDVASILFFFHPALPWAARRHAEAMEMACDWESLRDPSEAPAYAEGLCGLLDSIRSRQSARASAGALAMATHGRMARRIAALLEGRCSRPLSFRGAVGIGLLALLVLAVGCRVSRDAEPAAASPAESPVAAADLSGAPDGSGPARGMEKAVLDGLRWLARHQNPDGSWSPTTLSERCPCEDPVYNPKRPYKNYYDEGLTGLALLCFLGAGFSEETKQDLVDPVLGRRHKTGEIVRKGLEWLVARQNAEGAFSQGRTFMYNEALASLALTRAYALTQASAWKEPAQRSIDFIQAAQRPSPKGAGLWGWRYASRQEIEQFLRGAGSPDAEAVRRELYDADTSITGWCMLALESGVRAGLTVHPENLEGGLAFAEFATQVGADGQPTGLVGYLDARGAGAKVTGPNDHYVYHPGTMSAIGMCVRMLARDRRDDPVLERSARVLVADLPAISIDTLSIDYYYWHYATLALRLFDGPEDPERTGAYWGPWSKALSDSVLALQDHTERDCRNGGWLVRDRWAFTGGPIYSTALSVLTLEAHWGYEHAVGGVKRR